MAAILKYYRKPEPGKVRGRHPLRHLVTNQEFKTLATQKLGSIVKPFNIEAGWRVRVEFDGQERILHADVVVEAL